MRHHVKLGVNMGQSTPEDHDHVGLTQCGLKTDFSKVFNSLNMTKYKRVPYIHSNYIVLYLE